MTIFQQYVYAPESGGMVTIDDRLPWFEAHAVSCGEQVSYLVNSASPITEERIKRTIELGGDGFRAIRSLGLADVVRKLEQGFQYAGVMTLFASDRIALGTKHPVTPEVRAFIMTGNVPSAT